jgi:hypothetical protein
LDLDQRWGLDLVSESGLGMGLRPIFARMVPDGIHLYAEDENLRRVFVLKTWKRKTSMKAGKDQLGRAADAPPDFEPRFYCCSEPFLKPFSYSEPVDEELRTGKREEEIKTKKFIYPWFLSRPSHTNFLISERKND